MYVCLLSITAHTVDLHPTRIDITRFAVLPSYQSRGFGRTIMDHIIAQAKEQHLNIALSALSGKSHTALSGGRILITTSDIRF